MAETIINDNGNAVMTALNLILQMLKPIKQFSLGGAAFTRLCIHGYNLVYLLTIQLFHISKRIILSGIRG